MLNSAWMLVPRENPPDCWLRLGWHGASHLLPTCTLVLQELQETKEKFELGLGEAHFYHALAQQAQNLTADGELRVFALLSSLSIGVG